MSSDQECTTTTTTTMSDSLNISTTTTTTICGTAVKLVEGTKVLQQQVTTQVISPPSSIQYDDDIDVTKFYDALDQIPDNDKMDYLYMKQHATPDVINSEMNPCMFIYCEQYNYHNAAQRLIEYCTVRKSIFGTRAHRAVLDLSGYGALSIHDIEPFRRTLCHMILPNDNAGRSVFIFDDDLLPSNINQESLSASRHRCTFYMLTMAASQNIPKSQIEGFTAIRVIRKADYDVQKFLQYFTSMACIPLICHSVHFCGIPPKGAHRYFEHTLTPILVTKLSRNGMIPYDDHHDSSNSSTTTSTTTGNTTTIENPKKVPLIRMMHIHTKNNPIVSQLEKYGFDPCNVPISLGGLWEGTKQNMDKKNSIIPSIQAAAQDMSSPADATNNEICHTTITNEMNQKEYSDTKSVKGFRCLSEEANRAIIEQRKLRKRQMDVIYARQRRQRERCEETILQDRITYLSQSNDVLRHDNTDLDQRLILAKQIISQIELEKALDHHTVISSRSHHHGSSSSSNNAVRRNNVPVYPPNIYNDDKLISPLFRTTMSDCDPQHILAAQAHQQRHIENERTLSQRSLRLYPPQIQTNHIPLSYDIPLLQQQVLLLLQEAAAANELSRSSSLSINSNSSIRNLDPTVIQLLQALTTPSRDNNYHTSSLLLHDRLYNTHPSRRLSMPYPVSERSNVPPLLNSSTLLSLIQSSSTPSSITNQDDIQLYLDQIRLMNGI